MMRLRLYEWILLCYYLAWPFKYSNYCSMTGLSPYAQWFDGLAPDIAAKVATAKYRMQQGNLSSVEWFRGIGEYKINYGAGWRIYLAKDGIEIIMLLGGGSKNGQQRDIDKAVELWKGYQQAKANLLKKTQSIVATGKRKG